MIQKTKNIYFIAPHDGRKIGEFLNKSNLKVNIINSTYEALAKIYDQPPNAILLSIESPNWEMFIKTLKVDAVYGHLPIILIIPKNWSKSLRSIPQIYDDFYIENSNLDELFLRVTLRESHDHRYLDANPLTRLPGNFSIMNMLEKHIEQKNAFALGYVDIDNFKPFNDKYSFARGDDMIRMTARTLSNIIRKICDDDPFLGHIGGDDFVFIISNKKIHECCQQIIDGFELINSTLIDEQDRIKGFFESVDRQGIKRVFEFPSISISVIDSKITTINHPGEAAAIAAQLKSVVKKKSGSNYMINRRKTL